MIGLRCRRLPMLFPLDPVEQCLLAPLKHPPLALLKLPPREIHLRDLHKVLGVMRRERQKRRLLIPRGGDVISSGCDVENYHDFVLA